MFKIATDPIMAGTILCALQAATGPPASALDQWVELTNNTRMTIVEIYISHFGAQLWDIDFLGTDFLAPASSVWTSIDDAARCRFDFKTVFDDGTTQIRRNVNVCGVKRYAISFDKGAAGAADAERGGGPSFRSSGGAGSREPTQPRCSPRTRNKLQHA